MTFSVGIEVEGLLADLGRFLSVLRGEALQGLKKPHECPALGKECTPQHPLGATMVSSEGACAAYFKYRAMATS